MKYLAGDDFIGGKKKQWKEVFYHEKQNFILSVFEVTGDSFCKQIPILSDQKQVYVYSWDFGGSCWRAVKSPVPAERVLVESIDWVDPCSILSVSL